MTSEAGVETIAARSTASTAIRHAGRVVVAAAALGLAGQLLFFGVGLGINFPIFVGLLLAAAWRLRREPLNRLDLWLAPAALAFAAFAAVRADATLVALDFLTSITLAGAAVTTFGGRSVVPRPIGTVIGLALSTIGWIVGGAVQALASAMRALPPRAAVGERTSSAMPVIRGLVIAIPVVLVFVALFASADAIFRQIVDDLFGLEFNLGDIGWRMALALVLAWLAAGALSLAASTPRVDTAEEEQSSRWHLGITEIVIVMVAVDIVFAAFVALQAAYLFGGLDTMSAAGLTYSDYARRGFFELVAVAVMAGGLVVIADRLAPERTRRAVVSAMALAALTGVVLASAAMRLRLYQEAYGWTELRLYVVAAIGLLAVMVVALLITLATDRVRWIGHVVIVTALVIGLALNVIGPVRFITEQNVARVLDPSLVPDHGQSGLDEVYLASLDDDAIPSLLRAIPRLDESAAEFLRMQLGFRLDDLRRDTGLTAWQAWNAGRSAARDALTRADERGELP
ncbi:MAG TPA: DUF4173 domain-containing protein [Candidatus Limnocylindria bacterium]|nr:DUF4173 domain-containing protein [Candidatus Limnocylindria bacterium]